MPGWVWLLIGCAAGSIWIAAVAINRWRLRVHDFSGDPDQGIVIFVEPVRWLFIIWGFAGFCRGLRRSGCRSRLYLFRWCSPAGALLVIPDLVRCERLQRKAKRLARYIDELARQYPGQAIHLVGYSSGCYVTLEACRQATSPGAIAKVILLAGAISPRYRWDGLRDRLSAVYNFHSPLDLISALGPALFGSNDRRWCLGCGVTGFKFPPPIVTQRSWQPSDTKLGYYGDHFTITSPRFINKHVARILK